MTRPGSIWRRFIASILSGSASSSNQARRGGGGRDIAWRAARGDTIVHLDADRTWRPDGLDRVRAWIQERPGRPFYLTTGPEGQTFIGLLVVPRHLLERVGGYDASLQYYEDVNLIERLRALGPIEELRSDLYEMDWKGKMRNPAYVFGYYYYQMYRDAARTGKSRASQVRPALRRPLSWPLIFVGFVGFAVGRRLLRAQSRRGGPPEATR